MRVLVLGPIEVQGDNGVAIALSGSRLRVLTAVLALEAGRPVSTDRLVECLYGDDLPQRTENAVQLVVSRLRSALKPAGARGVVTRSPGYLLDIDADDVDALRFGRLVAEGRAAIDAGAVTDGARLLHQALDLWRGPALADFAFDDFAAGARARLEELRLAATEDCIEADLELGRHAPCAEQLEQLVAAHPLRERLWRLLMLALYRCGRQAEALRAFQEARRHLGEELGLDPGADLRQLEAAILAQDPSLSAPARATAVSPSLAAGNIPRPLTSCIGRATEVAAVSELLASHRLVTLLGPGGTGKTRLAVEIGRLDDATAQGTVTGADAWMVDLAAVTDVQGVASAVRSALGLQTASTADLAGAFCDRRPLIVLDNCEHVIDEAARVAAELLGACTGLRVIATSREPLGVPGEALYPVPPLGPAPAADLFEERARAAAPDIVFDEPAQAAVAAICARLDGLPLAIELAAARVRTLHVSQIAARLDDQFRLLTTGPRTLLPRQRTLRAVVDWSYDLLDAGERHVFVRLSVFAGGATLAAVEAVCDGEIEPALDRLVDKSLVTVVRAPEGTRYGMLQTLARYAAERLAEGGQADADAARRRHAAWTVGLVRAAERGGGTTPTVSLAALDAEVDNVDAAIAWARSNDASLAFDLAARLGWFWFWTGRIERGWQTLAACLEDAAGSPDNLRARACAWAGLLGAVMQAEGAGALAEAAVVHAQASGDPSVIAQALTIRAALHSLRGSPEPARADLDAAAEGYARSGDRHGLGMVWMVRGLAAMAAASFDEARAAYERSATILTAAGDDWAAGVARHRIVELDEAAAAPASADSIAVPAGFSTALVRAQLASVRAESAPALDALALAVADHIRGRVSLRGDYPAEARPALELALSRYQAQGHLAAVSTCLADLGRSATAAGDLAGALQFHAQAAQAAVQSSDGAILLSALESLSAALIAAGDTRRAGFALGAADALRDAGVEPWDPTLDDRASAEAAALTVMGAAALGEVRAQGRGIAIEQLLDELLV